MLSASKIFIKRSNTPGSSPTISDLEYGELAINLADKKIFFKNIENQISYLEISPYSFLSALSSVLAVTGNNTVTGAFSQVLGGYNNDVSGSGSTVLNGEDNDIIGDFAFIGGGYKNKITATGDYSVILAGQNNLISHQNSFILGSNLSSHASDFTYVNNLSAAGKLYGDGSELVGIVAGDVEATTLVRQQSANWGTGGVAQSIAFDETLNELSITYGNTISLSSLAGAGGDPEATTLVRTNSANWDSVYTSYNANSASIDASYITSGTLSAARLPTFNGDITADTSAGSVSATVVSIQGNPVSVQNPANGQILQWNGTAWVPGSIATGGSGGGGVVYYFNYANYTNISPTNGLPTSPVAPSLLGGEYSVGAGSLESAELTQNVYTLVAGFVSLSSEPAVTNIPAGLWDFNIWVDIVGNASVNQTSMQVRVYKYTSSTSTYTPLASSEDLYIYDPTVIAQYIVNVTMPQTTLLSSDRIYVEFWAAKSVNQSRKIRFWFDSTHPSHIHTTLPSVAGSGLVKTVNGVYQTPASLLVDNDVAANAAIDQSKINGLTDIANKANTTYTIVQSNSANWENTYTTVSSNSATWNYSTLVQIFSSSGTWTKPTGAKSVEVICIAGGGGGASGRVNAGQTGGGAGAGGGYTTRSIPAILLGATETVTIGASGAGGVGSTAPNAQSNSGTAGGDSSFGTLPWVFAGGGGGGSGSNGGSPNARTVNIGGYAGGGGGSTGTAGSASAGSALGAGGGGGGGGASSTSEGTGGNGFPSFGSSTIGGQSQGGFVAGMAGGNGGTLNSFIHAGGGGAGGAGNRAGNGGSGGSGGVYGGGGGGGGACGWYPGTSGQTYSSGSGGNGAQGIVIVTTYF